MKRKLQICLVALLAIVGVSWAITQEVTTLELTVDGSTQTSNAELKIYKTLEEAVKVANDSKIDKVSIYIKNGTYNLQPGSDQITVGNNESGWYLPITKANLTIKGESQNGVILTSTTKTDDSNYQTQNFITVFAKGVTLKNLTIKSKSAADKVIQVTSQNVTLENITFNPSTEDGENFAGSIYFGALDGNNIEIGTVSLKNLELNQGRIAFSGANKGNVNMENIKIDYTDIALHSSLLSKYQLQQYAPFGSTTGKDDLHITTSNVSLLLAAKDSRYKPDATTFANIPAGVNVTFAEGNYNINEDITVKNTITLTGSEKAKLTFINNEYSLIIDANDVVLNNLYLTSSKTALKINKGKTGIQVNGGVYTCSVPNAEGVGAIYFLGQNGDIKVSDATLTGKLGVVEVNGKLDGIKNNIIKYTSTASTPIVGISAIFTSKPTDVISPIELAAQNTITMPANGAQYPVLYETSEWKAFDGIAYANTKEQLATLVSNGEGVKGHVLIKQKANTAYTFDSNLTIQQEGIQIQGTNDTKLEFTSGGLIIDANDVVLTNLNIETKAGVPVTINASKTGTVIEKGIYSFNTLDNGDINTQGASAIRFMGSNGNIHVAGTTTNGIFVDACNGTLTAIKDNTIKFDYTGPSSFAGINIKFSAENSNSASIDVNALAAQNKITMPALGMQYDVLYQKPNWDKLSFVISGIPAVVDKKIMLTAGNDATYNGTMLQRSIDYAATLADKPEIVLGAGTYKGNFVMKPGVNVTGAVKENDLPITILDGEKKGRVVSYKADAKYDKTAYAPEETFTNAPITWSNLIFTNGKTTNDGGAGAIITKGITLKNCEIADNEATGVAAGNASPKGGGVMCFLGGTIDNCSIFKNKAADGGAGVVLNVYGTIQNSYISGNEVPDTQHSGGINTRAIRENNTPNNDGAGEMYILNCKVHDNKAGTIAGVSLNGNVKMINTLVYENAAQSSNDTEGAVTFGTPGATLLNCTIYNNTTAETDGEANVSVRNNSESGAIINCIMETVKNNALKADMITYSASKSLNDDETNHNLAIAADYDPFINISQGVYILADGSPYVDKGSNEAYLDTYPKTDLTGTTRIKGGIIDLGAYEAIYTAPVVNTEEKLKEELEKQPEEIVIEAPTGSSEDAELEIKTAITVDYPVTITASKENPVTITVEEGKSAFTTTTGGELTLENVTIVTKAPTPSGSNSDPVIKVAADTKATLQNSSLEVPATVTAIEAAGTMEISNVALTITSATTGAPVPAIKVASDANVTIKDVNITDGTIEVEGKLDIAPTKESGVVFTQTTADKAALDLKATANVTIAKAQFTGKAITAADGAQITLTGCNFTSPKTNSRKSAPLTKADNNGQVINANGAKLIGNTFSGITGEGAIVSGKSLTVKSCLFYDNADVVMINILDGENTIIANNTCVNKTGNAAIINNEASNAVIKNNILWTNATEAITGSTSTGDKITYNALKTAATSIETNSLQLTYFNAIRFDNTNHPYQLHKDSPVTAVAGDATGIDPTDKDLLGNSRLTSGKVHLGAYESVYTPSPSTGGDDDDTPTTPSVSSITLDKTTLTLHVQQTYQLKATVKPSDAPQSVTWSSSDPTIATVAKDGTVKALKSGTATITAEAEGVKATCAVTVDTATGIEELLSQTIIEGRDGQIQIRPATPVQVLIVNMTGAIVANRMVNSNESFSVSQGVYIVRLSNSGKTTTQKVSVR